MNKFIGVGYLGSDPEALARGCQLSMATEYWNGKENKTIWLKVFVFGSSADNCIQHKKKGDRVLIEGRIDISKGGNMVIVTDDVTFL
jgi:single-stranded DNA-binding protein